MLRKQEILTAAGTLGCAIGIGFVMQNGQAAHDWYAATAEVPVQTVGAMQDVGLLPVQDITLTSLEMSHSPALSFSDEPVHTVSAPASSLVAPDPVDQESKQSCAISLKATPDTAGIVTLSLSAPCLPNMRLSVYHDALSFSQVTDASGDMTATVPAFAKNAAFEVKFANGESATTETVVSTLDQYDRVAVQWVGQIGLQIHAREFGADYGTDGHVWSGAARDMTAAATGQGGFMTTLGDPTLPLAKFAQIYTFPKAASLSSGWVNLTVEAEVTNATCGREINAQTLQIGQSGKVIVRDVALNLPDCSASGDFLVLNNLLKDLRVARN